MSSIVSMGDEDPILNDMTRQLDTLFGVTSAYEKFGLTKPILDLSYKMGLVTTVDTVALESFHQGDTATTEAFVSGIVDKIKEWSAKSVASIKASGTAIVSKVTSLIGSAQKEAAQIESANGDGDQAKKVKTHTFRNVALCVAAALAVGGVVAACMGALPTVGTTAALTSATQAIARSVASIRSPFGSFSVASAGSSIRMIFTKAASAPQMVSGTIQSTGWTKSAIQSIMGRVGSLKTSIGSIGTSITAAYNKVASALTPSSEATGAGSNILKTLRYIWSVIVMVFKLTKSVVMGAMEMLSKAMSAVSTFFFIKNTAQQAVSAVKAATGDNEDQTQQTGENTQNDNGGQNA